MFDQFGLKQKSLATTCVLLISYAFLHFKLTVHPYSEEIANLSLHYPFGQRILTAYWVHCLVKYASLPLMDSYFYVEVAAVFLTFLSLEKLLQTSFTVIQARLLAWLFFLILPLTFVINYKFPDIGRANLFYPADTVALMFSFLGFYLCLKEKWLWFMVTLLFATLNRESSILIVLLIPALNWHRLKSVSGPFLIALLLYLVVRLCLKYCMLSVGGSLVEWVVPQTNLTNFYSNLSWLFGFEGFYLLPFVFAGLPLIWYGLYDYIPPRFRPLRYLTLAYFMGLLLVGRFSETRIFGEIIALLYLPVCLAVQGWQQDKALPWPDERGLLFYLDRYAVLGLLVAVMVMSPLIERVLEWLFL